MADRKLVSIKILKNRASKTVEKTLKEKTLKDSKITFLSNEDRPDRSGWYKNFK
jgi:hypothetical protein